MKGLVEWQFEAGGWLQVNENKQLAGRSSVTFVETDHHLARCRLRSVLRGLRHVLDLVEQPSAVPGRRLSALGGLRKALNSIDCEI